MMVLLVVWIFLFVSVCGQRNLGNSQGVFPSLKIDDATHTHVKVAVASNGSQHYHAIIKILNCQM